MHDLVLRNGHVIDPGEAIDGVRDIAFRDGRIVEIGESLPENTAREVRDVGGRMVVPGLIDLHTHVYWGGTSLGVDAGMISERSGTTTFVDAGSAGAGNFPGFRKHVIEPSEPRILAYVNISFPGIFGFSKTVMVGECADMRLINPDDCLRTARDNLDIVVGIKARIGLKAGGNSGLAPLHYAIEVADELGLPVMSHIDFAPPSQKEVLDVLRPGDILTHCFRPFPNRPIHANRDVRREVLDALERGVIFDIGHGYGGFSFDSARAMLAEGILPHVISSDVHVLCVDGPAHDLLAVMSKFMALGMPLAEVVRAATSNPAKALRREELGALRVGAVGDATILEMTPARVEHVDVLGEVLRADERLVCAGRVMGGVWWPGPEASPDATDGPADRSPDGA